MAEKEEGKPISSEEVKSSRELKEELKEILGLEKSRNRNIDDIVSNYDKLANIKKAIIKLEINRAKLSKDELKQLENLKKQQKELIKQIKDFRGLWMGIGGVVKKTWKEFQDFDKSARTTAISMGLAGHQVDRFRLGLNKSAVALADIGMSYSDIAKMQGSYSDGLGRAVILSTENARAMGEIAQSTQLGAEAAAALSVEFDRFGMSAMTGRDVIQETMDLSMTMGINAQKVVKIMQENLKLANKYNFREGAKNFMRMATMSSKFKLEIASVASMAEKLWEPEGAVEMAANLQVLGGEFSKLADPFKLMYMARNEMDELQKSIIKATKGMVTMTEDGLHISAQELHRLRYIADATGISVEELGETARQFARHDFALKEISPSIDPEFHDFITSLTRWDTKKQKWVIDLKDDKGMDITKTLGELENKTVRDWMNMTEKSDKNLEKRARDAMAFNETLTALWNKFKAALLPIMQSFEFLIREPFDAFIKTLSDEKVVEQIVDSLLGFAKTARNVGEWIAKNLTKLPATIQAVIVGLTGLMITGIFNPAGWLAAGKFLRMGFGPLTPGGLPRGVSFDSRMGGGGQYKYGNQMISREAVGKMQAGQRAARIGRIGGGFGLAAGGMALGYADRKMQEKGLYEEGSGAHIGMRVASRAAQFGGMGMMLGPKGAAIGAGAGAIYGAYEGISARNKREPQAGVHDDFISRPGEPIAKISGDDTVIGAKKGGPLDKMLSNKQETKELTIKFKPLEISGQIDLKSDGQNLTRIDLDRNPQFMRELTRVVQEHINMAVSGKLSPATA